jgi:C-terminal processing protease CtpA/Prc
VKLSSIRNRDLVQYIQDARDTKGLIIDIRNYPSEFVVFTLGGLLVDRVTPFAHSTQGDLSNPGAFYWIDDNSRQPLVPLSVAGAPYKGKIVILVDEDSQSQSEYTAMAFRAVPGARVVGSTTAGADGNISPFCLPGSLCMQISGNGVFYPDNRPTQRVGIVPDVFVTPTIAGIRDGRDEVLEEGVRQILGSDIPPEQVRKITGR